MYIVDKYKIYLKSYLNSKGKVHQRLVFRPVSTVRTNEVYIIRQCRYIIFISIFIPTPITSPSLMTC